MDAQQVALLAAAWKGLKTDDTAAAALLPPLPDEGLTWTSASHLTVGGRGFNGTSTFWERLPASANGKVNGGVYGLAKDSAGMSVRFKTSATTIGIRYRLISPQIDMWHMPSTGVSGADLYVYDAGNSTWRFVGVCHVCLPSGECPGTHSFNDSQ